MCLCDRQWSMPTLTPHNQSRRHVWSWTCSSETTGTRSFDLVYQLPIKHVTAALSKQKEDRSRRSLAWAHGGSLPVRLTSLVYITPRANNSLYLFLLVELSGYKSDSTSSKQNSLLYYYYLTEASSDNGTPRYVAYLRIFLCLCWMVYLLIFWIYTYIQKINT